MDINQVTLKGRLTKDPEFRKTNNGDSVAHFTLATAEEWKDKTTKEKVENSTFHNIVFWGYPEFMEKALKKGSNVLINNAKISNTSWEHEGKTYYKTEIIVSKGQGEIHLLDKKED